MATNVEKYLREKELKASPEMANKWASLGDLHSKRLWHQLTVEVTEVANQPEVQSNKGLIELYENFIKEFEYRIGKLAFMELAVMIVVQYDNLNDAYAFLDHCEGHVKPDIQAVALCKLMRGEIKLEKEQDMHGVKLIIEDVDETLKQYDGISAVHGRFYSLQSKYYLRDDNLTGYYKSAIKYLGCTPINTLPIEEQREHAKNLAISSLVADGMYNFGELLSHPVLNSLRRTSMEWILDLVRAFNAGDVTEYEHLRKRWITNKLLAEHEDKLRVKVKLMALMETAFRRAANERALSFSDIAHVTKVDVDEAELIVMKAFAQGLIGGKIDSVGQVVYVTTIQPRVLTLGQVDTIIGRLKDWQKDLSKAEDMIQRSAVEVMVD